MFGAGDGVRLGPEPYVADFDGRFWSIGASGFWKLERRQTFLEPGFESWELFRAGEWERSLELLERQRPLVEAHLARIAAAGFVHRRVRVVELPLVPYVQWELHALRIKDESGENVRIVRADAEPVAGREAAGVPLPELAVLGDDVAYRVLNTEAGAPDGALRYDAPEEVRAARELVAELHAVGEPLAAFFDREVAPLPPPPKH